MAGNAMYDPRGQGIIKEEIDWKPKEITIDNLRYKVVRKMWGIHEQDVLEITRLDAKYPWPTWEIPREDTAYLHIWTMFDSYCDQAAVTAKQEKYNGILYPWVAKLGLRHQGVLMSAMRSCDTAPRLDPSKLFSRVMRASVLIPHCGRFVEEGPGSYIAWVPDEKEWWDKYVTPFLKSYDQYPNHFVVHVLQASEVIGYCAPEENPFWGLRWREFYERMCLSLHLNPETEEQMHARLDADEKTFISNQNEMRRLREEQDGH